MKRDTKLFVTPEKYLERRSEELESTEGKLLIASLDSETCVELPQNVRGSDVFLIQALHNPVSGTPVDQNYLAFLIACRTFREHGAKTVTAVLPYLTYARQDKPTKFRREPTTARLLADLSITAGIDRIIVWYPHSSQIRGFYGTATAVMLEPLNFFLQVFHQFRNNGKVIAVAPDAGAAKLVTHFSRAMGIQSAVASKFRPKPENVEVSEVIGDFSGKTKAVILDDMISSDTAYEKIIEMHEQDHLEKLYVTDTIPQQQRFKELPFFEVYSVAEDLALTINRIHFSRSVSEVFSHPPEK